jgi:choline-sulfatase
MPTPIDRRRFIAGVGAAAAASALGRARADSEPRETPMPKPNVLFIMTDQQRADTIAALGNPHTFTPNLDRLVRRGVAFTNAYSTCPVCVAARLTIRTGREPRATGVYSNSLPSLVEGEPRSNEERCGAYLARTMRGLGYRTFGIGKFHTSPWDEDVGYDVHLHSEELYGNPDQRERDSYAAWVKREHPAYDFIEGLMGERTEMYYMPQMSPMPREATVESWVADRAVGCIRAGDERPYFGFLSFVGPHPPLAPPIPFNRMYDPDRMPNPVKGDPSVDLMDEYVRWMNHAIWAEDINDSHARVLKARYYGEISYIDWCLGRVLDAVEARPDADNTVICFVSDHGDHLGDHHSWQKESYFEQSCRIPYLVSWPARLPAGETRDDLVCLTDLFGIATTAAGHPECRDGVDALGLIGGRAAGREALVGCYGVPGTREFKVMVRRGEWKYIFLANGGREQLFNVREDPDELHEVSSRERGIRDGLRQLAIDHLAARPNSARALEGSDLRSFSFQAMPDQRIYQFDQSRGIRGFPEHPGDVLKGLP